MRCGAVLKSGRRCRREAADGSLCAYHRAVEAKRQARAFYQGLLSPDEQAALARAAQLDPMDAEIAMLRVLIHRVANQGDLDRFSKGLNTLCRMLRTKHDLDPGEADRLQQTLVTVLESLAEDLAPDAPGPGQQR